MLRIGRMLEKAAMKRENKASAVIVAMYAVVGASWIYFSDNWILLLAEFTGGKYGRENRYHHFYG